MQMELISRKEFDSRVTSGELDNLQAIKVKEGFCLIGNQSGTNRVFMLRRTDLKPFVWKNEIGPSSYAQTRGATTAFSTKTSFLWLIFKGYNMFKHWKNITIYKLSREADLTDLEDKKKMILFTPCGSQDMAKFGFVSPFGDNSEVIAMHGNGFILVEAKRETKILPRRLSSELFKKKLKNLSKNKRVN